ncbi:MAG: glycosyltransferase [Nitrospirota bacterium]
MNCLVLIFSKDRALQLDATLRSYLLHCRDAKSFQLQVLYTTSSPVHEEQYETLKREYHAHDFIRFHRERDFRSDLFALLAPCDYVLFLVDDTIFVRAFGLAGIIGNLANNEDAIGISLRLGRNTTYCYTLDKTQNLPEFRPAGGPVLKYAWTAAEYDFGYPLELSSSVYRTEDMLPYLAGLQFQNPNTLEGAMSVHKNIFRQEKPFLLCFDRSVAFSAPLNMVQTMWKNRTGGKSEQSADSLAELFAQGRRIDVHAYSGFSPQACHQEVELTLLEHSVSTQTTRGEYQVEGKAGGRSIDRGYGPVISVIIPCYNQAQYLPEAVESVVNQSYGNWECIIVNDGSTDDTGEVARALIHQNPGCDIRLLEKPNSGLADARNTGIREARGDWILPLDSDDLFAPDYMKLAVEIILKDPSVNLVTTNEEAFGATPHTWIPNEYTPQRILAENTFIYASVYKKELWEAVGGYYPGIPWGAEDWNFWIACSRAGIVQKRIPEKLFRYRTHPGTSMRNIMKGHWPEVVAMIHTLHPGLYPAQRLMQDHAIISSAHPDTVGRLDSLITRFPDLAMPYFWRGLVHERMGNPDLAQRNYEKSRALSGKDTWQQELCLVRVKALSSVSMLRDSHPSGDHLLSVSQTRDFLDDPRVPEQAAKFFEQADAYFLNGDLAQARDSIAQAMKRLPNNPRLMIAHGNILLRMEYVEAARKEFLRAKILDPESAMESFGADALMTLAAGYEEMGDHKNAVALYKKVQEIAEQQRYEIPGAEKSSKDAQGNIKVSAIVSAYNSERFIRGCLEDLINQTLYQKGELEIIVVDSGSQQNEERIIREFQSRYPHIKYRRTEERETVYAAWNRGIKEAEGQYITNANTDDRHRADALEKMADILDENPDVGLVYADAIVTATENQTFENHTQVDILHQPDFSREPLALGCFIGPQPIWRRTLHERHGFFDETFVVSGDWEFWLRIAEDTKFLHIPECLGLYLRSPSGVEQANPDRKNRENTLIVRKYLPRYWPAFEQDLYRTAEAPVLDSDSVYKIGFLLDTLEKTETVKKLFLRYLERNPSDIRIKKALEKLQAEGSLTGVPAGTASAGTDQGKGQQDHTEPLVSVIIPCYNQAQYLAEAVESVVGQTYGNWECIIVNDGSPDTTSAVAQDLIGRHPDRRIILLDKENGGLADARNFGIRHSQGRYILPLDADDTIHPEMLRKSVAVLESDPEAGIVYTDAVHCRDGTDKHTIIPFRQYEPREILAYNCFSYCSLYRREAWEKTGGYNTNMKWGYEDWDFWAGCIEQGFLPRKLSEPLFFYRIKESSMISKAILHDAELKARIILNHPGLYNQSQIDWARGIEAQDPETQSIPHREGVIPGFMEPLPAGMPAQGSLPAGLPQFAAVYCVYDDVTWLTDSVESIYFAVDAIYFLVSDKPWYGEAFGNRKTVEYIKTLPDAMKKIRLIQGEWTNETDQRNAGLDILREAGFTYCFVIDADEIYDPEELRKMKELVLSKPDADCWHVSLDTYWKSYRYRIEPREPLKPPVFVKACEVRFTENRTARGKNHRVIPPETGICHHLSYAHGDDGVLRKISSFSHAREIIPGWFENVWRQWDKDHEMMNLHPTHPHAYQKAVVQPYSVLPPVLKRRYLKDEHIPPASVPGLTSIIILAHNQWVQTEICLLSIERHTPEPHEIIVVDNGSTDETAENLPLFAAKNPNLTIIRNTTNLGFAAGNNQGIAVARGEFIVLLNNDTIVTAGWLGRMLDVFRRHPETGVVGPMSNYVSGPQLIEHLQHNSIAEIDSFAEHWSREHAGQSFPLYRVVGFCLLTARRVIEQIGGLDEQFGSGNFEDDDFCLRAALNGYQARVAQDVFIHHSGSQTFKALGIDFQASLFRNWELFKAKWGIPPDTPYGTAYQFPPRHVPPISLYAPLPLPEKAEGKEQAKVQSEGTTRQEEIQGITSIIILLSGRREYSRRCVESIRVHTKEPYEIIFVPREPSYAPPKWLRRMIKENKHYQLIRNLPSPASQEREHEGSFSRACNLGIRGASGEYLVLVNDAVLVAEDWLAGMLECLRSADDTGIVGPLSVNIEGQQRVYAPDYVSPDNLTGYARSFREKNRYRRITVKHLDSFCMLFRRTLTEKTGLFDERFGTHEYAAHDFCLGAAIGGFRNVIAGDVLIHFHGHDMTGIPPRNGNSPVITDRRAFAGKWGEGPDSLLKTPKGAVANILFLADELLQKGQKEQALGILAEGIQTYPDDERLHHLFAGTLIEEGKFREALDILEHMPEHMKQHIRTLELFGSCNEGLDLPSEAEEYADRILSATGASPRAWILKGTLAFRRARFSDAERYFRKAREADAGCGEAYANLGALKWQDGDREGALELFRKAFVLAPLHEDIVTNFYSASVNLKRIAEAERPFREATALHPYNRRLQFILVDNLLQQEKFPEAMEEMEKGILTFGIDDNTLEVALKLRGIVGAMETGREQAQIERKNKAEAQGEGKDKTEAKGRAKDKDTKKVAVQEAQPIQKTLKTQETLPMRSTISLCMIVKNEEENIGKALHSIQPVVNEMIVVDTGSSDRTKKIARVFGAKVYEFPWTNDFSAARNFSLSKATKDWILVLDADEVISPKDHNRLRELLSPSSFILHPSSFNLHPSSLPAYSFVTRNYVGPVSVNWNPNDGQYREEAGSGWFPSAKVRLFPNDARIRFDKPVHETVEQSLRDNNFGIIKADIPIHHYGKLHRETIQAKGEEYYQIGKKKLAALGEENPQAIYEIAIQASELEKFDESLGYWEKLIAVKPDFPNAYHGMGTAYYRLGRYDEAHRAFRQAAQIDPSAKDSGVMLALCELLMGNAGSAISLLEALLVMHPGYPLALLAVTTAYFCDGNYTRGTAYLEQAGNTPFSIDTYFPDIAKLLMGEKRYDYALRLLEAAVRTGNLTDETHHLLEECRRAKAGAEAQVDGQTQGTEQTRETVQTGQTISLCMIVRNEEDTLERALLSVRPLVDEMIVADTGSFDRTREIAKQLGAKVSLFPWTGNFSDARNFAISQASGNWILILDADEVISPSDHDKLRALIQPSSFHLHPSSLPAYSFTTRNYVIEANTAGWIANDGQYFLEEAGSGWYPGEKVRLFPNDNRFRFEFPVHERIEPSLMRAGIEIRRSGIPVHHYGKLDREKARLKAEQYYQLGKDKLAETGLNDASALYELAVQGTEIGRYEEALEYLKRVIALKPDFVRAYQSMGNVYFNTGRYEEALTAYRNVIREESASRDAVLMYCTCLIYTGKAEESCPALEELGKLHPDFPQAVLLLAEAYFCLGEKEEALKHLKTLDAPPFDTASRCTSFARKLIALGKSQYAVSLLRSMASIGLASVETGPLLAEAEGLLSRQNG